MPLKIMKLLRRMRDPPVKCSMPEQIPDTLENVARAVLNTPPKKRDEWEYLKKHPRKCPLLNGTGRND